MHEPTSTPPHHPTTRGRQVPLWVAVLVVFGAVVVTAVITTGFTTALEVAREDAIADDAVTIFRLKVDRDRNDILAASDVEAIEIPRDYIDVFGLDAVRESPTVVGQPAVGTGMVLSTSVRKGELLRDGMFSQNENNRMGLDLEPGHRLFTLPINTENQPPHLAPDDYVDLYANVLRRTGTQAVLVMERVPVRLVNSPRIDTSSGSPQSRSDRYDKITIEIDREQVQQLADIQSRVAGNEFIVVICGPSEGPATIHTLEEGTVNPEVLTLLGLN